MDNIITVSATETTREIIEGRASKELELEEETLGKYGVSHTFDSLSSEHGEVARMSAYRFAAVLLFLKEIYEVEWTIVNKYGQAVTFRFRRNDMDLPC